jgi:sodium-dependent dicarboxylate transporter 2/3/5
MPETSAEARVRPIQKLGFVLGGVVFILLLAIPAPESLGVPGWRTAAVGTLMAVWWMTEAIPIPATALLPLALFPLLGVLDMPTAAAPYANELIFLFMGGFLLAAALERWGLHRRMALGIMWRVGTSPSRLLLGFMISTAFISMWISNTATAAMMLPIALAVGQMLRPKGQSEGTYQFGVALMLGVAYASSIGGIATLIGTPPNAVFAGAASELLDVQIGFTQWMAVGTPLAAVMLPATWLLLLKLYPPGALSGDAGRVIANERASLGPASRGEKIVAAVFVGTALAWVLRAEKQLGTVTIPGIETWAPFVADSTVAMIAAALLFVLPVDWRRGEFALDWRSAKNIPWDVLVLFGGGLSLARGMEVSGLAAWIGGVVGVLGNVPTIVVVLAVTTLIVFLTEVTSNTATATMAMPVVAGAAMGLGMEPLLPMAAVALSASMAFMLPVATPPNAMVFASGYVTIPQMSRAGLWLNLISIAAITLLGSWLIRVFLA